MELKLARCTLRPWTAGDEASLVRQANNRRVWRNLSRLPHPYTTADADAWIALAGAQSPVSSLAEAQLRERSISLEAKSAMLGMILATRSASCSSGGSTSTSAAIFPGFCRA